LNIVLDASVVIECLLGTPEYSEARRTLLASDNVLCAPSLLRLEVLSVLRKLLRNNVISETEAFLAFANLQDFPIHYYNDDILLKRIWNLRDNITPYDAAYVALAESLEAPLFTLDEKLSRAKQTRASIQYLPRAKR
jgi:predicted nucleic acid-binding protein